ADWWFAVLSGILLLFIFSLGIFPGLYAPYNPRAEVGPALLAPGEMPPAFVLVSQEGVGVERLEDLAGEERGRIGIVRGRPSASALRDAERRSNDERREAGAGVSLRLRNERYDTIDEALAGLAAGEVTAVVGLSSEIEPLVERIPGLVMSDESITGQATRSFVLGTNPLGQDVLSRIIWGTRIALLIGFSAAVFALAIGVPLGLIAGFWSGPVERVLTLIMDS